MRSVYDPAKDASRKSTKRAHDSNESDNAEDSEDDADDAATDDSNNDSQRSSSRPRRKTQGVASKRIKQQTQLVDDDDNSDDKSGRTTPSIVELFQEMQQIKALLQTVVSALPPMKTPRTSFTKTNTN